MNWTKCNCNYNLLSQKTIFRKIKKQWHLPNQQHVLIMTIHFDSSYCAVHESQLTFTPNFLKICQTLLQKPFQFLKPHMALANSWTSSIISFSWLHIHQLLIIQTDYIKYTQSLRGFKAYIKSRSVRF